MPRQEQAEICSISTTGWPNQRAAAGCTRSLTKRLRTDTTGQASVAVGESEAGATESA